MINTYPHTHLQGQRGFTLLEVLIAVVVLSVGLLGLAALQATSLKHNQNSLVRSQISILSYDMIDRMRANIPGVTAGSYNALDTSALPTATNANCTSTTGCNAAAMALQDYYEWDQSIQNVLPAGEGAVCLDSTPATSGANAASAGCDGSGSVFVVKIWVDEDRDGTLDADPFVMSFTP